MNLTCYTGVKLVNIDKDNGRVIVEGTVDMKQLRPYLNKKLPGKVVKEKEVPPKKDDDKNHSRSIIKVKGKKGIESIKMTAKDLPLLAPYLFGGDKEREKMDRMKWTAKDTENLLAILIKLSTLILRVSLIVAPLLL